MAEDAKERADLRITFQSVAERQLRVDDVFVPSPVPNFRKIALLHEGRNDSEGGSLFDSNSLSNFGEADLRILDDAQQHVRIVGEEGPVTHVGSLRERFRALKRQATASAWDRPALLTLPPSPERELGADGERTK